MNNLKKGAAELIALIIVVAIVGVLTVSIATYLTKQTKQADADYVDAKVDNIVSVIKS